MRSKQTNDVNAYTHKLLSLFSFIHLDCLIGHHRALRTESCHILFLLLQFQWLKLLDVHRQLSSFHARVPHRPFVTAVVSDESRLPGRYQTIGPRLPNTSFCCVVRCDTRLNWTSELPVFGTNSEDTRSIAQTFHALCHRIICTSASRRGCNVIVIFCSAAYL